ncbi:MAG: GNAT family N-acetyltransferase [Clostridiales bacterium]
MYKIRNLEKSNLNEYIDIISNAYPGLMIDSYEKKQRQLNKIVEAFDTKKNSTLIGTFLENELVGCMTFFDFKMNLLSKIVDVGGLGSLAVHLLHKKEKIAMEMVKNFIYYYKNKNCCISLLYPFRSDFYKKMGFGQGSGKRRYSLKPADIPNFKIKKNLKFIDLNNLESITEYYNSKFKTINGLLEKSVSDFKNTIKNNHLTPVGYYDNNSLKGYFLFKFNKIDSVNPFINDIVVTEMLYDNPLVLQSIMTFLNSQSDQVKHVVFEISDENLKFYFDNPSMDFEGFLSPFNNIYSLEGVNLMYRINDVELLFNTLKNHNFSDENLKLKLNVNDNFIEENNKSFLIKFEKGYPSIEFTNQNHDVEMSIDISDLSSLITCSIDFLTLYNYGKISISKKQFAKKLNKLFSTSSKPICLSYF